MTMELQRSNGRSSINMAESNTNNILFDDDGREKRTGTNYQIILDN